MKPELSVNLHRLGEEQKKMKASTFKKARKAFTPKQGEEATSVRLCCTPPQVHGSMFVSQRVRMAP